MYIYMQTHAQVYTHEALLSQISPHLDSTLVFLSAPVNLPYPLSFLHQKQTLCKLVCVRNPHRMRKEQMCYDFKMQCHLQDAPDFSNSWDFNKFRSKSVFISIFTGCLAQLCKCVASTEEDKISAPSFYFSTDPQTRVMGCQHGLLFG